MKPIPTDLLVGLGNGPCGFGIRANGRHGKASVTGGTLLVAAQVANNWRSVMYFDRYDIAEAYYLFFVDYHEGGGSKKYQRLSRMSRYFKPSPLLSVETLTENGREIYDELAGNEEVVMGRTHSA